MISTFHCPECKNELILLDNFFLCNNCKIKYSFKNGIGSFPVSIAQNQFNDKVKKLYQPLFGVSKDNKFLNPDLLPKCAAAKVPAAGPDSINRTGYFLAIFVDVIPPLDNINLNGLLSLLIFK